MRRTNGCRSSSRAREVERGYVALVRGRPRSWRGRIDAPIGRDRDEPTRHSLDTDTPREAVTHFEVAELLGGHALLDVRLETGRTHQIRVHLAAIDLPVVGDPVYGVPDPALGRQFLHANRLAFTHPFTNERVEVESPLPDDLARTWNASALVEHVRERELRRGEEHEDEAQDGMTDADERRSGADEHGDLEPEPRRVVELRRGIARDEREPHDREGERDADREDPAAAVASLLPAPDRERGEHEHLENDLQSVV